MEAHIVNIFSVAGSVALVASVLLLWHELRNTNRLTRAANAQALVEMAAPFYLGLVQDRALAELCESADHDFASLSQVDQNRYRRFLIWWLIFYENIYYQRHQGLLDRHAFQPWWHDLQVFVRERNLGNHWEELKSLFQPEFAQQVGILIAQMAGDAQVAQTVGV